MLSTLANPTHFKCSQPYHEENKDTEAYSIVFSKPELKPGTLSSTPNYLQIGSPFWVGGLRGRI